jgi:hypothetical protein
VGGGVTPAETDYNYDSAEKPPAFRWTRVIASDIT